MPDTLTSLERNETTPYALTTGDSGGSELGSLRIKEDLIYEP